MAAKEDRIADLEHKISKPGFYDNRQASTVKYRTDNVCNGSFNEITLIDTSG